jgi:xylan 1,4-beta-xylosidase
VTTLACWALSDVFEEQGVPTRPFYGGYGLVAVGNIPKASYNAFKLLHLLGTDRIRITSSSALATKRPNGSLAIAVWNYAPPGETGSAKRIKLVVKGLEWPYRLRIHLLDRDHGSPLATWQEMGSPSWPTRDEQRRLREAAELGPPREFPVSGGGISSTTLDLEPHSLALVEVIRHAGVKRRPSQRGGK